MKAGRSGLGKIENLGIWHPINELHEMTLNRHWGLIAHLVCVDHVESVVWHVVRRRNVATSRNHAVVSRVWEMVRA
jgi:hypothetical protein